MFLEVSGVRLFLYVWFLVFCLHSIFEFNYANIAATKEEKKKKKA